MEKSLTVETYLGKITAEYSTLNALGLLFFKLGEKETTYEVLQTLYQDTGRDIHDALAKVHYYDDIRWSPSEEEKEE